MIHSLGSFSLIMKQVMVEDTEHKQSFNLVFL